MASLDLRREARRAPLDVGPLDIDDAERTSALSNWKARMVSEHTSARVFAELVPAMMKASIARRHVHAVARMVQQELDHGVLCAQVVSALGGEPFSEMGEGLPSVPQHRGVSVLAGVLRNVISIGCCSETVAVSLVATERERAGTDALRGVLDRILADEVKHSRFGWKLIAEVAPTLGPDDRAAIDRYLPFAFEHQLDFHTPFLAMGAASDAAVGAGAPDGPSNWRCFVDTMTLVVVPTLDAHGFGASEGWQEAVRRLPGARRWVHAA